MTFCFFIHQFLEFTKMEKSICSGNVIKAYSTLSAAKDECKKDENCNAVFDVNCDNFLFWTCQGNIAPAFTFSISTESSCVWERGKAHKL